MTHDSKFIATLSADFPQVLAVWEWTTDSETPVCTAELNRNHGLQYFVRFNPENPHQIVSNSPHQTLFYEWDAAKGIVYYAPHLDDTVR